MRPISGAAPGASIADHWAFMRDGNQAPACLSEVAAFADVHAPMVPSRAHLKRLARPRPEIVPARIVKVSHFSPAEIFRRSQRRQLGLPVDVGVREAVVRPVTPTWTNDAPRLNDEWKARYFRQCVDESIKLVRIMREMPFGPARSEVKRRATALLQKAVKHD